MEQMLEYYSSADPIFTTGHEMLGGVKYWDITELKEVVKKSIELD